MPSRDTVNWMLAESLEALARAERMHRQFFHLQRSTAARRPAWEPPIDVLETEHAVLILVALPGVDPEDVEAVIEDGTLKVSGQRVLPPELRTAVIHRLELPQGRFERRVAPAAGPLWHSALRGQRLSRVQPRQDRLKEGCRCVS